MSIKEPATNVHLATLFGAVHKIRRYFILTFFTPRLSLPYVTTFLLFFIINLSSIFAPYPIKDGDVIYG